jgi:hypothetical protein
VIAGRFVGVVLTRLLRRRDEVREFRGGEVAETLIRPDGQRLYDPFHLKNFHGVFSAIDPRIVDVERGPFRGDRGMDGIGPP